MSHEDQQCLLLGREVLKMLRDLMRVAGEDYAYARRTFSTRDASFHMILCNEKEIADAMEQIATMRYSIENALPPSKQN